MKDAEEPSCADKAKEATGDAHVVKNPETEEKVDEMGSENPEREEAEGTKPKGAQGGDENLPDLKEEIRGEKKDNDENKQVEEQKEAVTPLVQSSASAETPSIVGEAAKKNPSAAVAEPEKEPESSILGPESPQRKEGTEEVAYSKEIGALVDNENEAEAHSTDAVAKFEKESENSKLGLERAEKKEGSEVSHSEEIGAPLVHKKNEETATQTKTPSANNEELPHVPHIPVSH